MKKNLLRFLMLVIIAMIISIYTNVFANQASVDPSFDTGVPIGFDGPIYTMATQSDGRTIIGGDFTTYQ